MLRRTALSGFASACATALLPGCSVQQTVVDGARAPGYASLTRAPRLALVLSAGGPRGFAHVGVLRALDELGVRPDLIVGASIGSLLGAGLAADLPIDRIEELAFDFDFYKLVRWSPWNGMQLDGARIADMLHDTLRISAFEQLRRPLAVVASDLDRQAPIVFNQGDLGVAVQASCAIPGRFPPVRINGREVVDGDVLSPLPVKAARDLGALRVIAVDVAVHMDKPRPAGAARYLEGDRIKRAQIDAEAKWADLVLHPYFGYWVNLSREYRVVSARAAYEQTMAHADRLRALAQGGAVVA
jgi:NTE family protein